MKSEREKRLDFALVEAALVDFSAAKDWLEPEEREALRAFDAALEEAGWDGSRTEDEVFEEVVARHPEAMAAQDKLTNYLEGMAWQRVSGRSV